MLRVIYCYYQPSVLDKHFRVISIYVKTGTFKASEYCYF